MNADLNRFIAVLEREDRWEALNFLLDLKKQQDLSVLRIYEDLLTPALNGMQPGGDENIDIWKEHVRTGIIRTLLENMVPFLEDERRHLNSPAQGTAAVICPPEEYHDVGARMAADILSLAGYRTVFVGSNTPLRVFLAGLSQASVDTVAISVSNPYHLISAGHIIQEVRQELPGVRVILGGSALRERPEIVEILKPDFAAAELSDLLELEGRDPQ